ncbi:MAG TPA: type II toxin-antitoxin system PemK/MazF family toxin [Micromonosporaceae bacterium]|nr:type II toxin-antitoxin system PemK/MazF family toxin [Micromonosporaceae bacterium]
MVARGDVVDDVQGSRRIRVLVVSDTTFSQRYPVIVLIHDRADGNVPGILIPLPADLAGGGTIDLSRIRFADPAAFGHRHGRVSPDLMGRIDSGLRRLLAL